MVMKNYLFNIISLFFILTVLSCKNEKKIPKPIEISNEIIEKPDINYGVDFNKFSTEEHKIKRGDTFGDILENNGIDYPEVYQILQKIKSSINIRKLQIRKYLC